MKPDLTVQLSATAIHSIEHGARASCFLEKGAHESVGICLINTAGPPVEAGESRMVGLSVIPPEAVSILRAAGHFYLQSGPVVIAEVTICKAKHTDGSGLAHVDPTD